MHTIPPRSATSHISPAAAKFFEELNATVTSHPVLRHGFLKRLAGDPLNLAQLRAFAAQHYLYSRRFARNLAAVIANSPDEHARTLLVLNMYEEIGEPARMRDRVHLLLLEAGLVTGRQLALACEEQIADGTQADVVSRLIEMGVVTRAQVACVMEHSTRRAADLTHPAMFRRFLRALEFDERALAEIAPIPATEDFNTTYTDVCRDSPWLEGLSAMGPGTECVVPELYGAILEGIRRSYCVSAQDYVFWTIHVHCDDGHGRNILEAMRPYADEPAHQELMLRGALRVLDARERWFNGLQEHVFGEGASARHSHARLHAGQSDAAVGKHEVAK